MNGWWEGEASVSSPEPFSELADPGNYDSNIFSIEAKQFLSRRDVFPESGHDDTQFWLGGSTDPSVPCLVSSRISLAPEYCPLSLSVRPL